MQMDPFGHMLTVIALAVQDNAIFLKRVKERMDKYAPTHVLTVGSTSSVHRLLCIKRRAVVDGRRAMQGRLAVLARGSPVRGFASLSVGVHWQQGAAHRNQCVPQCWRGLPKAARLLICVAVWFIRFSMPVQAVPTAAHAHAP